MQGRNDHGHPYRQFTSVLGPDDLLQHLDLSKGTLGVAGARAIATHANAFAHLASLDLSENYLIEGACAELSRVAASVDVSSQKVEGEYGRFVTVNE